MPAVLNRWLSRFQTASAIAMLLLFGPAAALAQTQTVRAGSTDLYSSSERMISYRHQEHMWQTADGALHLVINRGTLTPAPGLALYCSFDGGSTWLLMQALPIPTTNPCSTANFEATNC